MCFRVFCYSENIAEMFVILLALNNNIIHKCTYLNSTNLISFRDSQISWYLYLFRHI